MLLSNVTIPGNEGVKHILVDNEIIRLISDSPINSNEETHIRFSNVIAFPGLINSHDHLDFNLFSQTGNRIYNNYAEWGHDIHKNNKEEISAVLKIPRELRVRWGIYKNLLNGVTTVVNHGKRVQVNDEFIRVFQDVYSLHSTRFENNWKYKLNRIIKNHYPFVIHSGEGADETSHQEIDKLIRWNVFKRKIIAVHGVAMDERQAGHFHALIWCPVSNYFLLNSTARVDKLKKKTQVIFGTDSTLTAEWNLWEHLRLARKLKVLNDKELFESVTSRAASVWGFNDLGEIANNKSADIIVAAKKNDSAFESFYALNPEDILLVIHKGNIRMFDEGLNSQLNKTKYCSNRFTRITMNNRAKYVHGDLPGLMNEIKHFYPKVIFPVQSMQ